MKKYWQALIAFLLVILLNFMGNSWVHSQEDASTGNKIDGYPVVFNHENLFIVQKNVASFSSEERAETISRRLEKIANDTSVDLNLLQVEEKEDISKIVIGTKTIVTLTEYDAKAIPLPRIELANE